MLTDAVSPAIYPGLRRLVKPSTKRRGRPFDAPASGMHWKPLDQTTDGTACGYTGLPFTANVADVECAACLRIAALRALPPAGVGLA